jgi:hypothetical protein
VPLAHPGQADQHTIGTDQQAARSNPGVKPPSHFGRIWTFITEPKHSNAMMAIFTILIFFTGALYTVFAFLQWRTMKDTLDVTRVTLRVDQRPYLKVGVEKPIIGDDGKVRAKMTETNFGKTPALDVTCFYMIENVPRNDAPFFDFKHDIDGVFPNKCSSGLDYPDEPTPVIVKRVGQNYEKPFSLQEVQLLRFGSTYLVVIGEFTYKDAFGVNHWTHFCYGFWCMRDESPLGLSSAAVANHVRCAAFNGIDTNN